MSSQSPRLPRKYRVTAHPATASTGGFSPALLLLGRAMLLLKEALATESPTSPLRYPVKVAIKFVEAAAGLAHHDKPAPPAARPVTGASSANLSSFSQIQALLGAAKAYILIEHYGGNRLHIPTAARLGEFHALTRLLGHTDALALARQFGGESVAVPTGFHAVLQSRNCLIVERYAQGETAAKLAREYGIAESSVYRIVNRLRSHASVEPVDLGADEQQFDTYDLFKPLHNGGLSL